MIFCIKMWKRVVVIFLAVLLFGLFFKASAVMKITRLECNILRKGVGVFEECDLKVISRNKTIVNVRFLLKEQVKKCFIRINFVKRANGWKPYLYNFTFNACDFMNHPQKYPLAYYTYLVGRRFTDVNHTCPYEAGSYMSLINFELFESILLSYLPIEVGDYGIQSVWHINREPVVTVNGYASYRDYRKF